MSLIRALILPLRRRGGLVRVGLLGRRTKAATSALRISIVLVSKPTTIPTMAISILLLMLWLL